MIPDDYPDPNVLAISSLNDLQMAEGMDPPGQQENVVRVTRQRKLRLLPHGELVLVWVVRSAGVNLGPVSRLNTGVDDFSRARTRDAQA